jgi:hypothetical protein
VRNIVPLSILSILIVITALALAIELDGLPNPEPKHVSCEAYSSDYLWCIGPDDEKK